MLTSTTTSANETRQSPRPGLALVCLVKVISCSANFDSPVLCFDRHINSDVMSMLAALLQGGGKERVVTRLLTSLEFEYFTSHMQALLQIMQLPDHELHKKIKTALEVEVDAMRERLKKMPDLDWKPPSKKELKLKHAERREEVKSEVLLDAFRFTVVVKKLADFRYPSDRQQVIARFLSSDYTRL